MYISLFRDSFPALRSVNIGYISALQSDDLLKCPWLHVIATGRPTPGVLKTIVLECDHWWLGLECCTNTVGTGEEVVDSTQRLPELLPELAELVIRLDECNDPEKHAAYIWNVLLGFHNVLRFEYRKGEWKEAWKPYTVLPQGVPQLLGQGAGSG